MTSGADGDDAIDDDNHDGDVIENDDEILAVTKTMMENDEQHSRR